MRFELGRPKKKGADLSQADLRGANLSGANLSKLKLNGADFTKANLKGTDLSQADLSAMLGYNNDGEIDEDIKIKTDLSQANLTGANLNGANLDGAVICHTIMPNWNNIRNKIHYKKNRPFSIKEVAIIQSFGDDFDFVSKNITAIYTMIGNAVPPLLANRIAEKINEVY